MPQPKKAIILDNKKNKMNELNVSNVSFDILIIESSLVLNSYINTSL